MRRGLSVLLPLGLTGCALLNRSGNPAPDEPAPRSSAAAAATALPAGPIAVRIRGETLAWNGNTSSYDPLATIDRDGELYVVTMSDGHPAFALRSGLVGTGSAGTVLFATNTAALRDVPGIAADVATAAIPVADVTSADAATFHAAVNPRMVRTVTVLGFEVADGGAPKQLLDGSMDLQLGGGQVQGSLDIGGADYLGGVQVNDRYRATMTSR